jgi:serine protease Do
MLKRSFLVLACLTLGAAGAQLGQSLLQGQGRAVDAPAAALPREISSYRDVVKKVLPAVVSIEAKGKGGAAEEEGAGASFGSGFLVSPKGVVVTNNHVVEGADAVLVQLRDGRKFTSRQIKRDPKSDLAIVVLDSKQALPFLSLGDSDAMEIGDRVLAVGAPFGLTGTVTHGIVSSKGRSLHMNMYEDFLQTDAAVNPGNSGGPLVSLDGKVIGINAAIKSRTGGFQGVSLAISSNLARRIVKELLENGAVRRGYLGVGIRDVDDEVAKVLGMKDARGVQITRLFPDGPGDKAGLKRRDVVLSLGGKAVQNGRELQSVVAGLPLGKPIDVRVFRDGKEQTLKVTIQEQPQDFGTAASAPARVRPRVIESVGLTVADLSDELAESLGYPDTVKGALVLRVLPGSLAAQAGIRPRMVIVSVEKKAVSSAQALADAVSAGSTAKGITVQARSPRGGQKTFVLKDADE